VHGSVTIREAIQQSCNVFFYQLMLKAGLDPWSDYARSFGFGKPTKFDVGEETGGLIPNTFYYDRVYGKGHWTQGYLVNLGVGQGEVGVSPLQMARYAAALANGGILMQPHAVSRIHNKRTNRFDMVDPNPVNLGISKQTLDIVREGMKWVVEKAGGTGAMARIPGIPSAGKTGTAENPHGADHSWYIGFAPFDNPTIAIAVLMENAGFGGVKAAPVAGKVMRRYLGVQERAPVMTATRIETLSPTSDANVGPDTTRFH
jgi:penicillin-binding protein 2